MRKGLVSIIIVALAALAATLGWSIIPHHFTVASTAADLSVPKSSSDTQVSDRSPVSKTPVWTRDALSAIVHQHPVDSHATWLLVGSDSRLGEAARSDAIIIARINNDATRVMLFSIPRDTRVWVQGHGFTKLNHAMAYGGLNLLEKTIERNFSVSIDHAIAVDFTAFSKLIDAIGGVTMHVDKPLNYDDQTDNTHIHIAQGVQYFNGKEALDYVRFRHDDAADIGRMKRHQELLQAIAHAHVPVSRWWDLTSTVLGISHHIQTDMKPWDVISLAAKLTLAPNIHIQSRILQGKSEVDQQDGLWYFYVDARDAMAFRKQIADFDRRG